MLGAGQECSLLVAADDGERECHDELAAEEVAHAAL